MTQTIKTSHSMRGKDLMSLRLIFSPVVASFLLVILSALLSNRPRTMAARRENMQ